MRRLRPLSEAECYARCYGAGDDTVRSVNLGPRRPRFPTRVTGEDLRRAFEARLELREPHTEPVAEGREPAAA